MKILLLSAISVLAMTSCSNDEDLALQEGEETLPVWMTEDGHFNVDLYNESIMDSAWYHESYSVRLNVLNIPEDVLPTLSSKELFYACSVHPFLPNFTAFNNQLAGVLSVLDAYNCYIELLNRDDFREIIAEYVISCESLSNPNHGSDYNSVVRYFSDAAILFLLDQAEFIKGMNKSVAKKLLNKCLEYQSYEFLHRFPYYYTDGYNEDGTQRIHRHVIDSVVFRLTEYLQEQK